jgi:TolA-binding protein/polyhydroxyalkanoate synthesis regulator phasin
MSSCGSSSFVGRQYDNLTAYYNKFYNANQAFEKGVQAFEDRERSIDRSRYLSIFPVPPEGLNESPFEDAIQKSADVLREHPNSKWVDDALLLIGKSYFYQGNYVGATQKFREVMALNTSREAEARFWLARTLVTSGSYAEASEVLRTSGEAPDDAWTARMQLVEGELLVRQGQWSEAERVLEEGLSVHLPDEVATRAAFLLGQVRETQNAPLEARSAYQQVQVYDPSYELGFAARLSDIELQGEHEDPAAALDRLEDLGADDKNLEKRGAIALARARIYRAQGQRERARKTLRMALYGEETARRRGSAEGRLHYDLALLYRDAYKDFSRAAAHFDTASTTLREPGEEEHLNRSLPAAPLDAGKQADRFRSLADRAREVAHLDSLLRVGRMSDAEFQAFVKDLQRKRQVAQEEAEAGGEQRTSRRRFGTSGETVAEQRQEQSPAAQTGESDAGFLFHQDPTRVQEGRRRFEQTWGDRPRVDNWRRRTAMRSSRGGGDEEEVPPTAGDRPIDSQAENGNPASALDLSAIPRDSASQAQMEADRAIARYELANSLFLAAGRPDSAATWYRRILEETGGHPVARQALYALAEAYRAGGDTTAAQQTYRQLIERHPETELAAQARRRLNRTPDPAAENRTVRADSAYDRALEAWEGGNGRSALPQLLDIAWEYPETEAAPRALLASGIIYWRRIQEDAGQEVQGPVKSFLASLKSEGVNGKKREEGFGWWSAEFDSTATPPHSAGMPAVEWDSLASIRIEETGSSVRSATEGTVNEDPDKSEATDSSTVADSVGMEPAVDRYAPLQELLTHLTEQYPDTPQAERARSMLALVRDRMQPSDSAATDSTARPTAPDSAAVIAANDTVSDSNADPRGQRANQPRRSRPSPDSAGSDRASSAEPLPAPTSPSDDADEGAQPQAWTILVQSFSERSAVMPRMREVEQHVGGRWTVDVRRDPEAEGDSYLLLVGRFDSETQANSVREQLEGQVSGELEVQSFSSTWNAP